MDHSFEPTDENWPIIHNLYMTQAIARWKESGGTRRDAMLAESQIIAASLTPPMTPKEFRSWDASMLTRLRGTTASKKKEEETMTRQVVSQNAKKFFRELGIPAVENGSAKPAATSEYQAMAKAALAKLKRGASRFIICDSKSAAAEVRNRLHSAALELKWPNGSFTSSVLPVEAYYDGRPVVLLAVHRN